MHNLATIMGRASSALLQSTFKSLSQTPGPAQPKSKIPAPEKYDSKKGPAAKSFMLDCKTYFFSNSSSFPSDHSAFPMFSNPTAAQAAERCLRNLKHSRAASNYATDFRIIASKLEGSDAALVAAFHQGLKAEVRSKLIEFTPHKNITTLDKFISTACLIDNTLFEACQELRKDSNPSTSALRPAQGRSGNFVSRSVQEQRWKAGEYFIDPQFTCSHNIPLIELDYPHTVIGINGRQVRDSIRFKCCLVFNTQGRHFSTLFHLLLLGNCNLILGTPWLILANPDINWFTLEVLHCLPVEARGSEIAPPITSILEEFKAFQKVFSNNFFTTLPAPCSYDCAIPLEDGKDIPHGPIYPLTPSEIAALKEHIDSEFAAGKICPSTSPTGAPVMFVKRANGRLCLVVDYCCLNAITIKDYYALPRQDELNEKLRHAKILTKLDLRNGYNNNCTKEGDKWKAAFRSKYGHFKPTGMQFGLTNAPAVFQRFMDDIFRDLLDTTVIVYLDNILIFSNSREEHVQHVKEVLSCLQKHNLFCNPSKCVFFLTEVTYIGLVVTPEGISTEQEKVKAIQEWPESRNVKQVQSFLGFANFYCHFVHDFSCLARSLTLLTQKNQPWVWEAARREAFHQIKIVISQEPVLAHPDQSQLFTLETDASSTAMGAVLSQRKDDGRLHPVAFMSASFSPADLNYDMHEKELLAIIRVFEHWRIFLEGTEHPVTVLTDHKNLEYWKSARTFNRCHARWHLILASYNFVIAYRLGKQSQKPDALSRRADHSEIEPSPQIMLPETQFEGFGAEITTPLQEQIKEAMQDNPSLDTVMAVAADPDSMPHSIAAKFKDYTLQDSLLLYQGRIVVPDKPEINQKLLCHFHDSSGSRHQGRARTLELISCHYCWPAMKFLVNCYVESRGICQRNKGHVQHFALKSLSVPAGPWEDVSYDFIVKLPKCRGNNSILVLVDCFSKMVHFIPCKETATAEDIAQLFLEHVWKLHGTPKQTVSDRGPTFNSKFLRAMYKAFVMSLNS
ncbi:Retrotransposable element Tf2 155 kDa protein type 3 [Rhizoctonia solani AG-1 IB]|uniref:Retrotransposable element Tf2 155 kDa protein type 3 n=1 Tax=Thanatephorus cucumeris (strain AG1-IB / isolate 7/3/14) TaxID=1108050 RepID=M5C965_THACB|nr:Retrotransposable element Tf2 155 kDa protein type 3 [Rhizoctonia solani AG-1 IB]